MCPFCLLFRRHLHAQSRPRILVFEVAFHLCCPAPPVFHSVFVLPVAKAVFFFSVSAAKANKLQPHRTAVYFPFFLFGFFFTTTIILLWAFLRDNITVLPKQNFSGCFQNIHKQISSFFFLQKKTTVWLKLFFLSLCYLPLLANAAPKKQSCLQSVRVRNFSRPGDFYPPALYLLIKSLIYF